jgi:hypothetical protein
MANAEIRHFQGIFASRLDTLAHLLDRAESAYGADQSFLTWRLAPDMFPFGTQVAFTCNQPRNFALWCAGNAADNLDPNVTTLEQARKYIAETKSLVAQADCGDAKLAEMTRVDLGPGIYAELTGTGYINEFLLPNFYFHLVTAYGILRAAGLELGKRDYMQHLLPFVRQG